MKKQYILRSLCAVLAALCLISAFGFTSVFAETTTGTNEENKTPEYAVIDLLNTDLSPYVKLGQYKDLDITYNIEVSDEELYKYALANKVYTEIKSRATKSGDMISASYVGNVRISNGNLIPVRGGTSQGAVSMTLDADAEDGKTISEMLSKREELIGVMPGSSVDITLTIPADYTETAMAGRDIIFTVTVASITEYGYTDEYVKAKYGCDTVEDYKLLIMKEKMKSFNELLIYEVYLHVVKNATVFKYPEDHYNYYYNAEYGYYKKYYESNPMYAQTYGSLENFLIAAGVSIEQIEQNAKIQTEKDIICASIYKTGIFGTVSDAEYESRLAQLAAENKMTVVQFETMYAGRFDISNLIIVDYTYENLTRLVNLTTDYNEYTHLLTEVTTPPSSNVPSLPGEQNAPVMDSNVILMIAIIAIGFIGCLVMIIMQKKAQSKVESIEGDDEEYEEEELEEEPEEEPEKESEETDGE